MSSLKLRFGGTDVLGQTVRLLEAALIMSKQNNFVVQESNREIAELNSKLLIVPHQSDCDNHQTGQSKN